MRFGIVTVSTYVALLVLLLYFVGNECKKKKSSFTFEALMAGMNAKEKEMFKEELNKEVKKFRASQQKHHKQKAIVRKAPKKRKLKDKLPKFLPGICDPICAHQCVHGCDFRCCIPDYQQTHKIPRPPPMVVLPGSCSPTCSPTCRPLCTDKCCSGGPGGMFQSSKDLITLDTIEGSCPAGCSKTCMPRCVISCCVQHMPDYQHDVPVPKLSQPDAPKASETSTPGQTSPEQESPHNPEVSSITHPVENHVEHGPEPQAVFTQMRHNVEQSQVRPAFPADMSALQRMAIQEAQMRNAQMTQASMLGAQSSLMMNHLPKAYFYDNMKCPAMCPDYCAPLCHRGCCSSAKRDYTKIPMLFKSIIGPGVGYPSPFKGPLQLKYAAMSSHPKALLPLTRQNCPVQCFASCKPNCEVRCCTLQPINKFAFAPSLHARDVQSAAFMRPLTLAQVMNHSPSQVDRGLPQQNAKLVQPLMGLTAPVRKRVETMDPNGGNFESNVETIHALSKDMISKPEPTAKAQKAAPRDHVAKHEHVNVKKPKHLVVRGIIPSNGTTKPPHDNHAQSEDKRSPPPSVIAPTNIVMKKSVVPARNPVPPQIIPKDPQPAQRAVRKSESVTSSETPPQPVPLKSPEKKSVVVPHPNLVIKTSNGSDDVKSNEQRKFTLPEKSAPMSSPKNDQVNPSSKATVVNQSSTVSEESKKSTIPDNKESVESKSHDVYKADISPSPNSKKNNNGDKKSTTSASPKCLHQCPDTCAPDCEKPCCNRQIVYEAFYKSQKRSKVKFQLEMLK